MTVLDPLRSKQGVKGLEIVIHEKKLLGVQDGRSLRGNGDRCDEKEKGG